MPKSLQSPIDKNDVSVTNPAQHDELANTINDRNCLAEIHTCQQTEVKLIQSTYSQTKQLQVGGISSFHGTRLGN